MNNNSDVTSPKYVACSYLSVIDIKESQSKNFQMIQQLFRELVDCSKSPFDTMSEAKIIAFYPFVCDLPIK
jgi:hypothetical protein